MNQKELIKNTIQNYIDGARSGKGEDMKPAFHDDATIFGYIGDDLFSGPIQKLYDWTDKNGPAPDMSCEFKNIDVVESIATVCLDSKDWTSFFTLLKVDDDWKIISKVFHLHK